MSGIFGKVCDRENSKENLLNMSKALIHRGPDDVGVYSRRGVCLGCRLLRTRGPQEGRQPIANEAEEVQVVLDGAIYNGDILRRELEDSGYVFHMDSDAELLLRLYEENGELCVKLLRGAFAFAIWDARLHRLILARDHIGQKPIFYTEESENFYFASEIKGLMTVMSKPLEIDFESLDSYLSMRFIPGSGTMVRGIKKLPPAHLLICDRNGISISKYWHLSFANKVIMSHDEYIEGLERKFQETVATHLSSTGTGAFLSGGLDSSLIVAMMDREAKKPFQTFSIGFAEKQFNEIPYARLVSDMFGTTQIEAQADTDLIQMLPVIINGLGEPSDPVALGFFAASHLASKYVKVALGGDGGNELFAGCDRYRGLLLSNYYSLIPTPVRKAVIAPLIGVFPSSFGYNSLQIRLRWFERMAEKKCMGERLAEAVSFFRFSQKEKEFLLKEDVRRRLEPERAAKILSDRYYESDADDPIERMLYTDYCTRLPEHLLMLVDRMGMINGLEVRSPLVDKELVEYMATFPLNMKIRGQKSRYIWYKLGERLLPESIAKRKKRGFRFPLAYWFAVKFESFLLSFFEDSCMTADGIFNMEFMFHLLKEHQLRKADHSWKIWMLLNLEVWYRHVICGHSLDELSAWIQLKQRSN